MGDRPIYIEFVGQDESLRRWLHDQIMRWLEQEAGVNAEEAFPNDKKSTTIKVNWE